MTNAEKIGNIESMMNEWAVAGFEPVEITLAIGYDVAPDCKFHEVCDTFVMPMFGDIDINDDDTVDRAYNYMMQTLPSRSAHKLLDCVLGTKSINIKSHKILSYETMTDAQKIAAYDGFMFIGQCFASFLALPLKAD